MLPGVAPRHLSSIYLSSLLLCLGLGLGLGILLEKDVLDLCPRYFDEILQVL